jgi:glutamyl-Q tRNA(Asp) synthetase
MPIPRYLHLPVATNNAGEKLSKQTGAPALDRSQPAPALVAALRFLGQPAPAELERASARTVLEWGAANWDRARIPRRRGIVPTP